jgi:hypothetical protein
VADVKLRPDAKPVCRKSFPTAVNHQVAEKEVLEDLQRLGKIRPIGPGHSNAPWFLKMEKKPDGTVKARPLVDYSDHSALFEDRQFPLPNIVDVLQRVSRCRFFTVLDLTNGFHQLRLPDDAAEWLAFSAGGRRWAWTVLPFGLGQAPTLFQHHLRQMFADLIEDGKMDQFVDDLVIMSDDEETHRSTCEIVRSRLLEAGIVLNAKKIQHNQLEVRLLGHLVSYGCIRPCPDYCDALQDRVLPRTPAQRLSFQGAVGWVAKFVPGCAKLLAVFRDDPCEGNFRAILDAVRNHVALSPMVPGQPLDLYADASLEGWGGVLMQNDRVLGCAGGRWNASERNWMVREQELQGVLRSLRHFRYYAAGAIVRVHTDHSSNCNVKVHKKVNQSKLLNWLAELGSWRLVWKHIPGAENVFADWLSRNPSDVETVRWLDEGRVAENELVEKSTVVDGTDGVDTGLEGGS